MHRLVTTIISLAIFIFPLQLGIAASGEAAVGVPDAKPAVKAPNLKNNAAVSAKLDKNAKPQITALRWANHIDAVTGQSKLRLVLDVTGPVTVASSITGSPVPQLSVVVKGAGPGDIASAYDFDGRIAESLRVAAAGADTNLVLQLPLMLEDTDYKVFTLRNDPANNKPFRVVIDIGQKVPPVKFTFTAGLKDKVIVLDPGHGGSDPGAVGANKTMEKTITLAVAQRLKPLLEKAGAKVFLTRNDDRDVFGPNASAVDELSARTTVANNNKADIFVSIHINSFTNPIAGGIATYYYQKTPYDALLANSIQGAIAPASGLQNRGINAANFYVIKRSVMPAVLTELGFISNPDEEKLMNTADFQQKMAQSIYLGLDKFFTQAARLGGGQ